MNFELSNIANSCKQPIVFNPIKTIYCTYFHSVMKRARKSEMPLEIVRLGERIKHAIERKELKVREVSHDAGMDVENLRKYIAGTQEMKVSTLLRIASALDMNAAELVDSLEKGFKK